MYAWKFTGLQHYMCFIANEVHLRCLLLFFLYLYSCFSFKTAETWLLFELELLNLACV